MGLLAFGFSLAVALALAFAAAFVLGVWFLPLFVSLCLLLLFWRLRLVPSLEPATCSLLSRTSTSLSLTFPEGFEEFEAARLVLRPRAFLVLRPRGFLVLCPRGFLEVACLLRFCFLERSGPAVGSASSAVLFFLFLVWAVARVFNWSRRLRTLDS